MGTSAVLYPSNGLEADIKVDNDYFTIGRAKQASYDIKDVSISRTQCIIQFNGSWNLCDKSNAGTWLNGTRLRQNEVTRLKDGDRIRLGVTDKYTYIFCTSGQNCGNSCKSRSKTSKLDAELAQRRRLFEFNASRQKVDLEKSILQNQQDRHDLEVQQKRLRKNFYEKLQKLEERNRQLCSDLENKVGSSNSSIFKEKELLEVQFNQEKEELQEKHLKETSDLASKIKAHEFVEQELKSQNKILIERLEAERQQFEMRLEEEKKLLELKFAEQLAEQQKLTEEKSKLEEALRRRIEDLERMAHQEEEQQQQRKAEQEKDEERLSKEKIEFEERLKELQNALHEKEKQDKEKEQAFLERERELKAQEELIEQERKERAEKLEAEFLAKRKELEQLENERIKALDRHKEEVTKELQDREAELKRKAEEHQRELEAQKAKEQDQLKKELEEKEQAMRRQLEWEMMKLQEEKVAIEMNIRGEQSKVEGENATTLKKLQEELEVVKFNLQKSSNKRELLEKELEEASRAKEAASKCELEARRTVVENFGELMESELQCSICNELFVLATTLNCTHTFCQLCISNWLEKKRDCPICRAPSVSKSRSIVLDNFIDKMVENLSDDLKKRRKDIVEERRVLAHVAEMEENPNKKRKTAPRHVAVTMPLQIVNHNVVTTLPNTRVLLQVPSIPAGAAVYRPAPGPSANRGALVFAGPSTSQMTPAHAQAFQQQRQQQSQRQPQPLAHPSSSAPNQMTTQTQTRPGTPHTGVRTRGGGVIRLPMRMQAATRPPNSNIAPTRPPYIHSAPVGAPVAAPRTVPPLILRAQGAPGLGYAVASSTPISRPTNPHH
ncbi:E3 ubiquitin-protein ligase rnf8 [Frankliniella fusca]|uniref:E3 ubiquitin-protein ligase CHFR n=1 Tax=Frankliniella fusca TaxID=407009 RepID=A0AAE1GUL5_9NEOP|nr:E3 ubiquitin-protein ligase rnf8 [Frankliniella fusca]